LLSKIVKNNQLLGEAGVVGLLVEVLRFDSRPAAVLEKACWALTHIAADGEWR